MGIPAFLSVRVFRATIASTTFMKKFGLKSTRFFMSLALAGFFLGIFSFALEYSMGMEAVQIIERDNCLFVSGDHDKMCKNALAEHLSLWQALFAALPNGKFLPGIFGAVFAVALAFIFQRHFFVLSQALTIRQRQYLKRHPSFLLFDFLRTLFSRGILNHKAHILSVV